jgi:hypothetical protein
MAPRLDIHASDGDDRAMQTVLSQFCEEFEGRVRPVLEPLDRFASSLGQTQDDTAARSVLPALLSARHRLRALMEKVERQQAYVIIFGPLKSGKSTLMNAMSGAYVSEVTTLPAYPCMVYFSHAEQRELVLTRYDGSTERLTDVADMRAQMNTAHGELSEAIRACESRGEEFDPVVHLPRAVRRVDVRTPAEQLAGSGAVLVDTPGLYSRMKFGYDLMTRECRDSAASAVFVVKTDNLFLEQVFAEFSDLLRLFSRIFLVVNLDSTKQDLQPDGWLGSSLECVDPQQIVEAFERLAMNASLKEARDDGRLRIYPIDLLRAASKRLRAGHAVREHDGEHAGNGADAADDFSRFLSDLTQYLNSTDYLVAFLGDSLRQGSAILDELKGLTESAPVVELSRQVEELEKERSERVARAAALAKLASFGWDGALGAVRDDVERITIERSTAVRNETGEKADAALAAWFDSDQSFGQLLREGLGGVLDGYRDQVAAIAREVTQTVLGSDVAVATALREQRGELGRAQIDLTSVARATLAALPPATPRTEAPKLDVPVAVVQVKKTIWDHLLLRSQASVRRRLLGPDAAPEKPLPRKIKQKRLGATRVILGEVLRARFARFASEVAKETVSDAFAHASGALVGAFRREVEARRNENTAALERGDERLQSLSRARDELRELLAGVELASGAIGRLTERFVDTSPTTLLLAAPAVDTAAETAAEAEAAAEPARAEAN